MKEKLKLAKTNYLIAVFLILVSLSILYWFLTKQQEAESQELTEEYMELTTKDSESILDRAKFITKRDGQVDIAVLGSSVTRGKGATAEQPVWGTRVEQRLNQYEEINAKVWNRGYNGYSTTDLLVQEKITETIESKPDIVIFELCLINNNRFPQNDLSLTKEELIGIMNRFQENLPNTLVILTTANPTIYNDIYLDNGTLTYDQYNDEVSAFVQKQGWNFIDIYSLMSRKIANSNHSLEYYLDDAVHPNGEGYNLWYTLLDERLSKPLSDLK
ncbi:hypothetical protein BKP56_05695 [Marinilactibacillus sp. 15R]|uniref:Lysophospholipase L1 n=1 Tax=Marinilactibacillus piezotolerans TaxID=258723 RepID=A0A1I3X0Y0_9LACT|nr:MULTISPECIES: SGNH/GDSL hydrolase family protein [Marinilactibacillus]API88810.1 hypothetical protein BKP56_05695 [Marinilactibacillus sp. 15R]SFK12496.1 Lysophospholipase L1 [Marinilactibacillus piezotolerans]